MTELLRPVLMISGWGTGGSAWRPVRAFLEKGGVVRSLGWHEGGDGEGDAGRIGSILSSAEEPWVLVGWSLGALLALSAASLHPSRVSSLVLLSATARLCTDGTGPGADPRALRAMRRLLPTDPDGVLSGFADLCARPDGGEGARRRFLAGARRQPASLLARGLDLLARIDLRFRAQALPVPVRLLHGDEDGVVPPESAEELADLLPSSRLAFLPGRGHALPWTIPEEAAGAIEAARR